MISDEAIRHKVANVEVEPRTQKDLHQPLVLLEAQQAAAKEALDVALELGPNGSGVIGSGWLGKRDLR